MTLPCTGPSIFASHSLLMRFLKGLCVNVPCRVFGIIAVFFFHGLIVGCGSNAWNNSNHTASAHLSAVSSSREKSLKTHCISRHIHEAIALNHERLPLYAAVSEGRSRAISYSLLNLEKLVLATLPLIERPAEKYQEQGIPLFCLDVVPMSDTPQFMERVEAPERAFVPFNGLALSLSLAQAGVMQNKQQLEQRLERALETLNENKNFNCMTRHLLESILRSVRLTPVYQQMSAEKGLRDPGYLLRILINTQISALGLASHLDAQAAELNAEGIPVICNDLPHIETNLNEILGDPVLLVE